MTLQISRLQVEMVTELCDSNSKEELELDVEPEDVIELLQFPVKPWVDKVLLMEDQRKSFLEKKSAPGEDTVSTIEMVIEDFRILHKSS